MNLYGEKSLECNLIYLLPKYEKSKTLKIGVFLYHNNVILNENLHLPT
jgi:hypothetical protein